MDSYDEMVYRENYIEHKRGTKAKSFDELIRILGEPIDDEEKDMLASRVHEIIWRRLDIVSKAEKICGDKIKLDSTREEEISLGE